MTGFATPVRSAIMARMCFRLVRRLLLTLGCLPAAAFASCDGPIHVDINSERIEIARPPPGYAYVGWIEMTGAEWEVMLDEAPASVWPPRSGRVPIVVGHATGPTKDFIKLRHLSGLTAQQPKVELRCRVAVSANAREMQRLFGVAVALAHVQADPGAAQGFRLSLRLASLLLSLPHDQLQREWLQAQMLWLAEWSGLRAQAAGWAALIADAAAARGDALREAEARLSEALAKRYVDGAGALQELQRVRTRFEELNEAHRANIALQNICLQKRLLGDVENAVSCYRMAVDAHSRSGELHSALRSHLNLATALSSLGRFEEAQRQLATAREIADLVNDDELLASLQRQEAQQLTWQGRFDDALALLADLRDHYDKAFDPMWSAATDQLIGMNYRLAGEPARAVEYYQRAEERIQGTEQPRLRVRLQLARAAALSELGRREESVQAASNVLADLASAGDAELQQLAWLEIAEVLYAGGRSAEARDALKQLPTDVGDRYRLRRRLLAEKLGEGPEVAAVDWQRELEATLGSGQLLSALAVTEHLVAKLAKAGDIDAALRRAEQIQTLFDPLVRSLRSPALRDAVVGSLHNLAASIADGLPDGRVENQVAARLHRMLWKLAESAFSPLPNQGDDALIALERALGAELLGIRRADRDSQTIDLALPEHSTQGVRTFASNGNPSLALRPDETLALPLVGGQTMGFLVYHRQSWTWRPVNKARFIEERDRLIELLASGHAPEDEVEAVVQTLRGILGWNNWLSPGTQRLWLGAHRAITPAPVELTLPVGTKASVGWVLSPSMARWSETESLWVLGVSFEQTSMLAALSSVSSELDQVASAWPLLKTHRHAASATRGDLITALAEPGALVHLAAHGRASPSRYEASGLWLQSDAGSPTFVSAHRLRGLNVGASLVVLAACETGGGAGQVGIGVGGVASALVEAGASGVIGSRWAIGDRAAAAFSKSFHLSLARTPASPEIALNDAVRALRGDRRFRNTTHWSGWFALFRGVPRAPSEKLPQS